MDVESPLVPRPQLAELLDPRDRPLDDSTHFAQTGRAWLATSGQQRVDAPAV